MGHKGRPLLSPEILCRVYKIMNENPLKTFTLKELTLQSHRDNYMKALIGLKLVEQVPTLRNVGRGQLIRTTIKGYRLLR
jgi:hypothetical protein